MHLPRAPYFVVETPKLNQPAACCPHLWGYHNAAMAMFIITTMTRQYYKSNRTDVSGTAITWVTCIGSVSGIGGKISKKLCTIGVVKVGQYIIFYRSFFL